MSRLCMFMGSVLLAAPLGAAEALERALPGATGFSLAALVLLVLAAVLLTSLGWALVLRRLRRQLAVSAQTDALTGLANRAALDARFAICHEQAQRYARPFALMLLDIDHLRRVNEERGHQCGDKVLQQFSQLLQECIRGSDGLGRWGGEEFLLLCPETSLEQAVAFAERICARARGYAFASGQRQTLSAGVAELMPGDTLDALLQRAEAALTRAKQEGRDRVCFTANDELDGLPL
ncbi:MAG TPA: GGDEF domain-containing protein [Pseudomonas sp.]|nr:GGDEF domain-containing protein [Pseudomonas sp.]